MFKSSWQPMVVVFATVIPISHMTYGNMEALVNTLRYSPTINQLNLLFSNIIVRQAMPQEHKFQESQDNIRKFGVLMNYWHLAERMPIQLHIYTVLEHGKRKSMLKYLLMFLRGRQLGLRRNLWYAASISLLTGRALLSQVSINDFMIKFFSTISKFMW